jgi:hypothetical protein
MLMPLTFFAASALPAVLRLAPDYYVIDAASVFFSCTRRRAILRRRAAFDAADMRCASACQSFSPDGSSMPRQDYYAVSFFA